MAALTAKDSTLLTQWGQDLDTEAPLPEYPRPGLVRTHWTSLNGFWDYAITAHRGEVADPLSVDDPTHPPRDWDGKIVVPFSPETFLSGVQRLVEPDQTLWYQRDFEVDPSVLSEEKRVLLHFGAVDQSCRVAVDGTEVGGNVGGYLPFTLDITDVLRQRGGASHTLTVAVRDVSDTAYLSTGKQALDAGGIWYPAQSGIWQTVWLETVPTPHVQKLRFTPSLDQIEVAVVATGEGDAKVRIGTPKLLLDNDPIWDEDEDALVQATVPVNQSTTIPIPDAELWSPEEPLLYPVRVTYGDDAVDSYFALRTLGVGVGAEGNPALLLNGQPYYAAGVLDQGYWPDGGYTAPADAALVFDITTAKDLGYNMLRKHVKVEPMRWYYHCDRLGMLVWQDAVNGGRPPHKALQVSRVVVPYWIPDRPGPLLGRQDPEGLRMFAAELADMIDILYSSPSVVMWVPFNEGWGQFDANLVAEMVRGLDPTRPIDHASGWFDQGGGDVYSRHVYFRPATMMGRGRSRRDRRVMALTEYGGLGLELEGHRQSGPTFGYSRQRDSQTLLRDFTKLHSVSLPRLIRRGLGASVYTQLTDVEGEVNGLLTYDRRAMKMPAQAVRDLNLGLREQAATGLRPPR